MIGFLVRTNIEFKKSSSYVLTSTNALSFPNGMIETLMMTTGSPVILRTADQIIANISGAIQVPAAGPWILTLRLKVCDISIPFNIQLPSVLVSSNQFKASIKTTIRTNGATGTTYSVGKFQYMSDSDVLITTIKELGFIAIDTTSTINNLELSAQFDGSPTGLALFSRGGAIKII